jgi:hypothetical protein
MHFRDVKDEKRRLALELDDELEPVSRALVEAATHPRTLFADDDTVRSTQPELVAHILRLLLSRERVEMPWLKKVRHDNAGGHL